MKTCTEGMREFYFDQMDRNELLRKRPQDPTQENLTLNAHIAKLEFLEKTAIKAEQLSEVLTRFFHHIIPLHGHGPIVSKAVQVIIQGDINDVIQGGNSTSSTPRNASPLSTSITTSSGSSTFPDVPNPPAETRDTLNLRRSSRIRALSQPRFSLHNSTHHTHNTAHHKQSHNRPYSFLIRH